MNTGKQPGRGTMMKDRNKNRYALTFSVNEEANAILRGICKEYNVYMSQLLRGIVISFLRKKGLIGEQKKFNTNVEDKK